MPAPRLRPQSPAGPLARVLASGALARVVTHFVLRPDAEYHFQAIRRATGLATRSLQHELARLATLGMVHREPDRRLVRYRAVAAHPRWRALRTVVREFAGPEEVLRVALPEVPGVEGAFIYGSFVRTGQVHPASNVDVLVIGDALADEPVRRALAAAVLKVAGLLGREVHAVPYTHAQLAARRAAGGPFIQSVLSGEKAWLVGNDALLDGWQRLDAVTPTPARTATARRTQLGRDLADDPAPSGTGCPQPRGESA